MEVVSNAPVLATPDFSKPIIIECDAFGFGIGVALMQEGHPIAFESGKLNKRGGLKSTYNKEMIAIMHALLSGDNIFWEVSSPFEQTITISNTSFNKKNTFRRTTKMD